MCIPTNTHLHTHVRTYMYMYVWLGLSGKMCRFVSSASLHPAHVRSHAPELRQASGSGPFLRRRRRQYIQDTLTIVSMHEPCKTSGSTLELVARLRASFSNWRVQPSAQPHESDHRLEQALEEILRLFHIVTSTCAGRCVCKGKFGTIAPVWSWFPMRSIANIAKV